MIDSTTEGDLTQAQQAVESLIKSRTETLTRYKDVMNYHPFEMSEMLQEVLEDFCESMVDYTAKVHFNLAGYFDENGDERRHADITDKIFPTLVDNTQSILDFHDQYSSDVQHLDCEKLEYCLNQVGELLADRISLEDHIINAIMSRA